MVEVLVLLLRDLGLQVVRRLRVDLVDVVHVDAVLLLELLQVLDLVDLRLELLLVQRRVLHLERVEVVDHVLQEVHTRPSVRDWALVALPL